MGQHCMYMALDSLREPNRHTSRLLLDWTWSTLVDRQRRSDSGTSCWSSCSLNGLLGRSSRSGCSLSSQFHMMRWEVDLDEDCSSKTQTREKVCSTSQCFWHSIIIKIFMLNQLMLYTHKLHVTHTHVNLSLTSIWSLDKKVLAYI